MEQVITALIYIHALFGGVGLITGMISIFVIKGGVNHKKAGKIFSFSMVVSALISLIVSRMPNHENLFLFLIGIFTIYMIVAGNRALTLRSKVKSQADWIDKMVSGTMLVTSIIMLIIGVIGMTQKIENSILYLFFGIFGTFMTIRDFKTFKKFTTEKNTWLVNHIGRMVGALIASVTAFLVAGLNISTLLVWISPTILGTGYIIYWSRKVKNTRSSKPV